MQFTKDEIEQLAKDICPHCKAGSAVRQRADTKEWVHDNVVRPTGAGNTVSGHGLCWANGLRTAYGRP